MDTKYVEIKRGIETLTVTEKAYHVLYASKGFKVTRSDVEPPAPADDGDDDLDDDDTPDPFDLEVARVLRGNVGSVVAWVESAEDADELKTRALAVFRAENVKPQPRPTLLDAVSNLVGDDGGDGEPDEGDGEDGE